MLPQFSFPCRSSLCLFTEMAWYCGVGCDRGQSRSMRSEWNGPLGRFGRNRKGAKVFRKRTKACASAPKLPASGGKFLPVDCFILFHESAMWLGSQTKNN